MPTLVSYALVSLADVKESLSITDNTQDSLLINLINRATDIIEKYCNRRFILTTYTEQEFDGTGDFFVNLTQYPVTSVTKIEVMNGDYGNPSWSSLDSSLYKYLDTEGQIYYSGGFQEGIRNYRITYSAGYTTIPNDLAQACITLISYLKNQTKTSGMKSEKLGEYSYTKFEDTTASIKNLGLDEILDAYRIPSL